MKKIKLAFYKLAQQYHPDKETGDADKFKSINNAYEVLGDADKKKIYDGLRQEALNPKKRADPF
jgi:DnaJ-class molecular chaperone